MKPWDEMDTGEKLEWLKEQVGLLRQTVDSASAAVVGINKRLEKLEKAKEDDND